MHTPRVQQLSVALLSLLGRLHGEGNTACQSAGQSDHLSVTLELMYTSAAGWLGAMTVAITDITRYGTEYIEGQIHIN